MRRQTFVEPRPVHARGRGRRNPAGEESRGERVSDEVIFEREVGFQDGDVVRRACTVPRMSFKYTMRAPDV